MSEINLEILTPEKTVYKELIDSITVPGTSGSFQVLKNHAPIISSFEVGVIAVKKNGTTNNFTTSGGTVEVEKNKILLISDSIELVNDIDFDRAIRSKERAEKRISQKGDANIDLVRAQASLARALNRINACNKYLK
ncbi:MAG TPA: ATP synthase F1 subunit epsilon [Ignavibacteriaceae bacterium]